MSRAVIELGAEGEGRATGRWASLVRWAMWRPWLVPCLLMLAAGWPALFGEKWHSDAPRYTIVSMMVVERGDWWTLSDGWGLYFNKPPLAFWVRGAMIRLLGPQNWATRLPDVLAAVGVVWALVDIVRRLHGRRAAMLSGIVLATTWHFAWFLDALKLEYMQLLMALLAAQATVAAVQHGQGRRILLAGVWVGLGLMVKPLVALYALPLLMLWVLIATERRRLALWFVPAALVAVAIAAPWHVSMVRRHGDLFVQQYFEHQVVQRATGETGVNLPWWYYFGKLWVYHWPWLVVLVAALASWAAGRARPRGRAGTWLMVLWAGGWVAGLTLFAGKAPHYLIQLYPGLAWVCGAWLARVWPRDVARAAGRFGAPALAVGLAAWMVAVPIVETKRSVLPRSHRKLIEWLEAHPEEEVYNQGLLYWTLGVVYIKTGRMLRADTPPVTPYGQRAMFTPVGTLTAARVGKMFPEPRGEIVFKAGNIAIYRKAPEQPQQEVGR